MLHVLQVAAFHTRARDAWLHIPSWLMQRPCARCSRGARSAAVLWWRLLGLQTFAQGTATWQQHRLRIEAVPCLGRIGHPNPRLLSFPHTHTRPRVENWSREYGALPPNDFKDFLSKPTFEGAPAFSLVLAGSQLLKHCFASSAFQDILSAETFINPM